MSFYFGKTEPRPPQADNGAPEPENWGSLSLVVQIFLPLAIVAILCGRQRIGHHAFPFFDNYFSVLRPSLHQQERLLKWMSTRIPHMNTLSSKITSYWKNGSLLCILINSVVPGACPNPQRHWKHPPTHGQALAFKYLGVTPVLTEKDFNEKSLTPYLERIFIKYLLSLQDAINKLAWKENAEITFTSKYVARGMGLVTGEQNRTSIFYIYPNAKSIELENVLINIKGPYNTFGKETLAAKNAFKSENLLKKIHDDTIREQKMLAYRSKAQKSFFRTISFDMGPIRNIMGKLPGDIKIEVEVEKDRFKVSFTPKYSGMYELVLTSNGEHLRGSPFNIRVVKNVLKIRNCDEIAVNAAEKKTLVKITDFDEFVDTTNDNLDFEHVNDVQCGNTDDAFDQNNFDGDSGIFDINENNRNEQNNNLLGNHANGNALDDSPVQANIVERSESTATIFEKLDIYKISCAIKEAEHATRTRSPEFKDAPLFETLYEDSEIMENDAQEKHGYVESKIEYETLENGIDENQNNQVHPTQPNEPENIEYEVTHQMSADLANGDFEIIQNERNGDFVEFTSNCIADGTSEQNIITHNISETQKIQSGAVIEETNFENHANTKENECEMSKIEESAVLKHVDEELANVHTNTMVHEHQLDDVYEAQEQTNVTDIFETKLDEEDELVADEIFENIEIRSSQEFEDLYHMYMDEDDNNNENKGEVNQTANVNDDVEIGENEPQYNEVKSKDLETAETDFRIISNIPSFRDGGRITKVESAAQLREDTVPKVPVIKASVNPDLIICHIKTISKYVTPAPAATYSHASPICKDIEQEVRNSESVNDSINHGGDVGLSLTEKSALCDPHCATCEEVDECADVDVAKIRNSYERKFNLGKNKLYSQFNGQVDLLRGTNLNLAASLPNLLTNNDSQWINAENVNDDTENKFVAKFREKREFWKNLIRENSKSCKTLDAPSTEFGSSDLVAKHKPSKDKSIKHMSKSTTSLVAKDDGYHLRGKYAESETGTSDFENGRRGSLQTIVKRYGSVHDRIRVFEKGFDSDKRRKPSTVKILKKDAAPPLEVKQADSEKETGNTAQEATYDQVEENIDFMTVMRERFENAKKYFKSLESLVDAEPIARRHSLDNRSFGHELKLPIVSNRFSLDNLCKGPMGTMRNGGFEGCPNGSETSLSSTGTLGNDVLEDEDLDLTYYNITKKTKQRKSIKSVFDVVY